MAMEEDNDSGHVKAMDAAVRAAKKAFRPAKIGEPERRPSRVKELKEKKRTKGKKALPGRDTGFGKEMGQSAKREGVRAKKGVQVGAGRKKGGKRRVR